MNVSGLGLLLVVALSSAPFQCVSEVPPEEANEETPGRALYELAQRFRRDGDEKAWRTTLGHLIERFPSSRFAETARRDLGIER
jgi:outer membrane protein assembly factor BamD (BamD/ComL family)